MLALVALFDHAPWRDRRALALQGTLSILAGGLALVRPEMTAQAFVYVIAVWAIVMGRTMPTYYRIESKNTWIRNGQPGSRE